MGKQAFITGGSGFLGGHIVRLLIEQGWTVTALHRPGGNREHLLNLGARPVAAQLHGARQLAAVRPAAPEAVFHVAGNTAMWRKLNAQQYRDNVLGTRAVVHAARQRGAHRLIHTSSISAYGIQQQPIDESTPSNAEHDWINYNRTKYLGEQEVRDGLRHGLDAVILNPCGIIGAGDTHNGSQLIALIDAGQLPGVPPGAGSFCHVTEVAKAHIAAVEKGRTGANYILSGVDASFLELARTISDLLHRKAPRRAVPKAVLRVAGRVYPLLSVFSGEEPRLTPEKVALVTNRVIANSERAQRELGFNAAVPLRTMLEECIQWMRAEGMLQAA
jgi:dihydroflavonol-4-reductase